MTKASRAFYDSFRRENSHYGEIGCERKFVCFAHHSSTAQQNFLSIFIMHVDKEAHKKWSFWSVLGVWHDIRAILSVRPTSTFVNEGRKIDRSHTEAFMLSTRYSRLISFHAYRVFPVNLASLSRWYPSASAFDVCASGELERARQHKLCGLDVLNLWREIKERLRHIFIIFSSQRADFHPSEKNKARWWWSW